MAYRTSAELPKPEPKPSKKAPWWRTWMRKQAVQVEKQDRATAGNHKDLQRQIRKYRLIEGGLRRRNGSGKVSLRVDANGKSTIIDR